MVIWKGQLRSRTPRGASGSRRTRLLVIAVDVRRGRLVAERRRLERFRRHAGFRDGGTGQ